MDENSKLLRSQEVAKVLNISDSYAYQLMRTGELPTVRIGRAVRCSAEELRRYIQQQSSSIKQN